MKLALYITPEEANLIGQALDVLSRQTPIAQVRPVVDVFDGIRVQCANQAELVEQIIAANTKPNEA